MNLVVIAAFMYPHEAHLAKSKLEAYGIKCLLTDELTVQTHNFYSNAIEGVKLKVREEDVELANEIMNAQDDVEFIGEEEDDSDVLCPKCSSNNTRNNLDGRWALLSYFLMGAPLPFLVRRMLCFDCGEKFKKPKT